MKRKLILAVALLLFVFTLGGAVAATTDPIVCSIEVAGHLTAPGDVTVTITVSNSGETDMTDPLTLYSPTSEVVKDFGDNGSVLLKAGEVKTWTGTWSVNQNTLNKGQVVYFVKYFLTDEKGTKEAQSQPIRGQLNATEAKADIEIKRTISPGTARKDQTVTVKYDIVNTGTESLKNITIKEHKDISTKTHEVAKELKAGETAQVKFPVKMGKKDLTSSATITYTVGDDKTKQTKAVGEQKITYGEAALTAKLTSSAKGAAINETVKLTLELKNSGSVNYSDVRVTDTTLGDVFTNQELAAGATLKLEKEIPVTETKEYQLHIVAIDNTGTTVELDTDSITLTAVDPSNVVHLNVVAAADRTEVYTQPGIVRFTVTVENDSSVEAKEVGVFHGETKIYTFPVIPAGESRKLTRDAALSMEGKYQFTAVVVDALENSHSFTSNEIQIAFSVPTPAPETPTPPLVPTPEPTYELITVPPISHSSVGTLAKTIRTIFYPLMIVGIILLIGSAVLLLAATKKRMDQKKSSATAMDHLDRAKRRDYVTPSDEMESKAADSKEPLTTQMGTAAKNSAAPRKIEKTTQAQDAGDSQHDIEDVELPHMKYVRNAHQRTPEAAKNSLTKRGLYDADDISGAGEEDTTFGYGKLDEPYHTYGDDDYIPLAKDKDVSATKAESSSKTIRPSQPKDWSAYVKPTEKAEDPFASYDEQPIASGLEAPMAASDRDDYAVYDDYQPYDRTNGAAYDADQSQSDYGYGDPATYGESGLYDHSASYTGADGYADDAAGYDTKAIYEPTVYDNDSAAYSEGAGYGGADGYMNDTYEDAYYEGADAQPYSDGYADGYGQPDNVQQDATETSRRRRTDGSDYRRRER